MALNNIAHHNQASERWASLKEAGLGAIVSAGGLLIGAALGFATAFAGPLAGAILGAVLAGVVVLFFPLVSVWILVAGSLGVVGLVELYLPALQTVRWAFVLLSVCLAGIGFLYWVDQRSRSRAQASPGSGLAVALGVYFLACMVSLVVNWGGFNEAVISLKNYFQMWGLILAMAWIGFKPTDLRRLFLLLGVLALIQLPFVLHQFLVLVPLRSSVTYAYKNIVAIDIVAGTFGGLLTGGGRTPDLALLVVIAVILFFAHHRCGLLSQKKTYIFSLVAFTPIFLCEAKLALVLLPLGLLILYREATVRKPFRFLLSSVGVVVLLVLIVIGYANLPGAEGQRSASTEDFFNESISYNLGKKGYGSAVLNRSTVYGFWGQEHLKRQDLLRAFVGHGPGFAGATVAEISAVKSAAQYRGYGIGLTGLSSLLWDVGLLGATLFVGGLVMAFRLATQLIRYWHGTEHEPLLETARIALVLFGVSLLHVDYIAFDVGYQTMLALILGYLLAMARSRLGMVIC